MVQHNDAMTWAEFDEVFAGPSRAIDWATVGFDTSLPIVEVGPGTGRGLVEMARALPGVELFAIEPDPGNRAVLTARIMADVDLASRVSILEAPVGRAPVPQVCGGVVATGVLFYLNPAERSVFWRRFHQVLGPGGIVVLEAGDAPNPQEAEKPRLVQTAMLGRWRHERWFSQRPLGHDEVEVVNEARVFEGDRVLRVECDRRHTWVLSDSARRREAREAGFDVEALGDGRHIVATRR